MVLDRVTDMGADARQDGGALDQVLERRESWTLFDGNFASRD